MESEQPYESLYDQAHAPRASRPGAISPRGRRRRPPSSAARSRAPSATANRCGACGVTACVLGLAAAVAFRRRRRLRGGGASNFLAARRGVRRPRSCLQIVDSFLRRQPRQTFWDDGVGLMQTFHPDSVSGGPCGDQMCKLVEPCPNYQQTPHCRYDVYDNALAAIYLSKRGKLDEARGLLDAFIKLLYPGWAVPGLEIGGLPSIAR